MIEIVSDGAEVSNLCLVGRNRRAAAARPVQRSPGRTLRAVVRPPCEPDEPVRGQQDPAGHGRRLRVERRCLPAANARSTPRSTTSPTATPSWSTRSSGSSTSTTPRSSTRATHPASRLRSTTSGGSTTRVAAMPRPPRCLHSRWPSCGPARASSATGSTTRSSSTRPITSYGYSLYELELYAVR